MSQGTEMKVEGKGLELGEEGPRDGEGKKPRDHKKKFKQGLLFKVSLLKIFIID